MLEIITIISKAIKKWILTFYCWQYTLGHGFSEAFFHYKYFECPSCDLEIQFLNLL